MAEIQTTYKLQVAIHQDDNGYWATVVQLPGVFAAGATQEELREALEEAIVLYVDETGIPDELDRVEIKDFNLRGRDLLPA